MTGKWKWILLCLFATGTLILGACGGGGSSSGGTTSSNPVSMTGQFIDSAVSGLIYQCSSGGSGITNAEGEFTCQVGDTVEFFVGGYSIGSATANKYITPYDLYPENDGAAINVAQLLLTLDSDDDPSNGITIPEVLPPGLGTITVQPGDTDFATAMATALEGFVSAEVAQSHLESSYENLISTWDYHLDIGDPFYNVFFEENDQGIVEKLIITFELTSDSAAKATFEGTTDNGTWGLIDDLDYGEILNITVTGQDPGYYRLDGIEENRLNVCYADSLDTMDNCDVEYFYLNLADAQAHGEGDTGGDTGLGDLTFQGTTSSVSYLYFDNYGCVGSVCNIDISITPFQLDSNVQATGSGRGIYLEMFFPTNAVSNGTYTFSMSEAAGTFSNFSGIGVVDGNLNLTEYNATGDTVTITVNGSNYVISGTITTSSGTATFSYSGSLTGEFF